MIAMRGQKYPISDIGLTNLLKKLIERGQRDLDNPNVSVTITKNVTVDGIQCELIQVRRSEPSGGPDDFSLAEIVLDGTRNLPIRYTAYGWPKDDQTVDTKAPLIESYTYLNIKTNVGLTDLDFDPTNPEYQFR
jgi:outer membrane lipoprotein-sorting protein